MTTDEEHARISGLLAEYAAGTLGALEQNSVAGHLATCAECRRSLAEWHAISIAIQGAATPVTPGRGVLAGVHMRIAAQRTDQRRSLAFLFQLVSAQAPLVRPQIWAASALVMSLGIAVTFVFGFKAVQDPGPAA